MTEHLPARLRAIARYGVLEVAPGRELHDLVNLAARVTGASRAAVNIITDVEQRQIAALDAKPSACPRQDSMCDVVLQDPDVTVVPDARLDPRFAGNAFVVAPGGVRFYASAPLTTADGVTIGRLCVFDGEPRELDDDQVEGLGVVAERLMDVLELRLRTRELEESLHELTETRDELHRSNDALGSFAARVSHDLQTPLTAMLLNLELATDDPAALDNPALEASLEAAMAAGQRMSRLVLDLLQQAQVGSRVGGEVVDLDELLADVLEDLMLGLASSGGSVTVAEGLGAVRGDRGQLYAIFLNLVSNALKFTRPGEAPVVSVTSRCDGPHLVVEVMDRGVGVPEELRDTIFGLFERAGTQGPGAGVGLASVKAAVEAHGGTVGVRARDDGGSAFWVRLPRVTTARARTKAG